MVTMPLLDTFATSLRRPALRLQKDKPMNNPKTDIMERLQKIREDNNRKFSKLFGEQKPVQDVSPVTQKPSPDSDKTSRVRRKHA